MDVDPSTGTSWKFLGNLEEITDSAGDDFTGIAQNNWNFGFDFIKSKLLNSYGDDFKGDAKFGIELRLTEVVSGDSVGSSVSGQNLITNHIDVNVAADTFQDNAILHARGIDAVDNDMYAGTGLPVSGFHLATDKVAGVELGLKVQKHQGDYGPGSIGTNGNYTAEEGVSDANQARADWSFSMSAIDLDVANGRTFGDETTKGNLDVEIWVDINPGDGENFVFLGNLEEFVDSKGPAGVAQNNWNIGFDFIKSQLVGDYGDDFMGAGKFGIELRLTEVVDGETIAANQLGTTTLITNHIDVNVVTDFALV